MRLRSITACLLFLLLSPSALLAWNQPWHVQAFAPDESFIVLNDGNNLRRWGGPDYAKAPILGVLDAWDEVTVLSRDGRWAEVQTPDGMRGFVNATCLAPYREIASGGKEVAGHPDREACAAAKRRPMRFLADLDGTGRTDTVTLRCEPWRGNARAFLTVADGDGQVRLQGPTFGDSPLIFRLSEGQTYWPEAIADIDHDGKAELLVLHEPSDDRVSGHTFLRWNGQGFTPLRDNVALIERTPGSGMYAYSPNPGGYAPEGCGSISAFFAPYSPGKLEATVVMRRPGPTKGSCLTYRGRGLFEAVDEGFKLIRWTEPLKARGPRT